MSLGALAHSNDMVHPQVRKDGAPQITGLEKLMRLLTRLKKHGIQNAHADEVWDDEPQLACRSISSNHAKGRNDLSDLRRSLDEAKSCMAALNDVRDHLAERIELLREACIPMVLEDGIKTLPNELISQMFEHGHDMSGDWNFAICVSHVSRRFRQVSLKTPILWSTIWSIFPDDQVQVFLARSREKDLEISTLYDCDLSEKPFAKLLRPHLNRVVHLKTDDTSTMEHLGLTNFPRLRGLHCEDYNYVDLSSWHVPLLSKIFITDIFDGPLAFHSLTCVDFSFFDRVDVFSFSQAVSSMTSLMNLSVAVAGCSSDVPDSEEIPRSRDFHTVHIETLRITITHATPRKFAARLYDALGFLFPSTVLLQLTDLVEENPPNFLRNSAGKIFPYGSTIIVHLSSVGTSLQYGQWDQLGILSTLVAACDIAHTIRIEAPIASLFGPRTLAGPVDIDWELFASLRHLQLECCDRLYVSEVKRLADSLIIGAKPGTGLQSLEILSCRNIPEAFLSGLGAQLGPKLKWKL